MRGEVRILNIITRLNIGGASSHTINLTERLNSNGFRSVLASGVESEREGNMIDLAHRKGIEPPIMSHLRRDVSICRDVAAVVQLYLLIKKHSPHIVHAHTTKAGTLGRIAAWLAGVPVIVFTLHGSYFYGYFSRAKTRMFTCIERLLSLVSDRIIAVSDQERREIIEQKIGTEDKVIKIPLGLELDDLFTCDPKKGILRSELGIEPGRKLIGIVARLVPIKGHRFFLDAARLVLQSCPDLLFLIIGDGELRQELEEYASSLGIAENIVFLGFRRDLPTIYADLDIVALSSLNEGLPVSVIEAMAAAKPIVATCVGGVPELLDEGRHGIIVPPSNSEKLANGILEILDNPEMGGRMGELGRKAAMERYTIDTLVENITDLYQQLLEEKGIATKQEEKH